PWLLTSPDERLLYVTEYWPESSISWRTNFLDLTFSHEVDLSTFTADDVQLTSGGRAREIIDIAYVGDATYRLALAELLPAGPFNLEVGPNIADHAGHLMDQDWDGTRGEPFDDVLFVDLEVDLTPPQVQRHQPAGDIAGTVDAVDVFFSERMNPASFTTRDVEITAPDGSPVAASSIETRTQGIYRVHFPDQTEPGVYTITVGPHITDPAAHPLDQDNDGTPGEPTDAYQGTFNLVDVDLEISNVTVDDSELRAGETVNVSWDGANNAGYQLLGDWTDAVYLSADDAWDYDDVLLATVPHTGGLLQDEVYHESRDVVVPGVLPGDYYIIVRADLYNQEKEAGLEGNNVTAIGPFTLEYNVLTGGGTADSGTLSPADRFEYYTINLDPGENLRLTLDGQAASGSNRLYYGQGEVPTRQSYHGRASSGTPDAQLTIPGTYDGGDYYILAHASQIAAEQDYELTGQDYKIILDEVSPNHHGNAADATVTLSGDGFNETTTISFIAGDGTEKTPVETTRVSPTQMTATLDLHDEAGNAGNWAADVYDARVANTSGGTYQLADALQVYEGVGPILDVNLSVPKRVGFHRSARLWVEYENVGDAPMPAPMFVVQGSHNALMTANADHAGRGLWTANPPDYLNDTVHVWGTGSGASPGTLQPGDSGRVPIFYRGIKRPWPWGASIEFSLGALTADEDTAIAWDTMKADARPEWLGAETWDVMWQNFTTQTGDTWGDFVQTRSDIVNYIHGLGQDATDLTTDQVLGFAVALAADVGPNPYLAGSVDAATPAPGLPLVFSRVYDASFESRYDAGPLGRGWTHNWQFGIDELSNGDVVVRSPGADRFFHQQEDGSFQALPGDFGALSHDGNAYQLSEKNGTSWQFDSDGRLHYVEDTNDNRVTLEYTDGRLTTLTHGNGEELTIGYNGKGLVDTVTDPNGPDPGDDRVTQYSYTASGEYLSTVTMPDGRLTEYTYQTSGELTELHALLSAEYPDDRGVYFEYDHAGRLVETDGKDGVNPVSYHYDSVGEVRAVNALGVETVMRRGLNGQWSQVSNPVAQSTLRMTHNDTGLPTDVTGPQGELYRYSYDAHDNVTAVTDPMHGETGFSYEPDLNRLDVVTDARGNAIDYDYDDSGNLTKITYEDGTHESFTHDDNGNVKTWTNRRGQTVSYAYNAAGQVTSKDYDTTPDYVDYEYTYDTSGNLVSASYTTDEGTSTTQYTYDADAQWLERIDYPGGQWFEFEYDDAGRRTKRTDQLGHVENYTYDDAGRLDVMTDESDELIVDYDFDAAGRMSKKTLGNGVYTTYDYDEAGRLIDLGNYKADDSLLSRFQYTYDASGRVTSKTSTYPPGDARTSGTETYGYDRLGQLTRVEYPDGRVVEYVYDSVGNRVEVIDDGIATPYTTNHMNQYSEVGDATYEYDDDGNLISKTEDGVTTTYTYNAENRLVRIEQGSTGETPTDTWEYVYDAGGNRVETIENGVPTDYVIDPTDRGNVAAEINHAEEVFVQYSYSYGLVSRQTQDSRHYYAFDALGSTSELIGSDNAVLDSYAYGVYGQNIGGIETSPNRFEFGGEIGHSAIGASVVFMGTRLYDGSQGRFVQRDSLGLAGGDINEYRFAANLPTTLVDRNGNSPTLATAFAGGLIGGGLNT
ncbi:MAG: RHS repeat-associated core domain-containing protein, partial [Pirellulaceae bacterium]